MCFSKIYRIYEVYLRIICRSICVTDLFYFFQLTSVSLKLTKMEADLRCQEEEVMPCFVEQILLSFRIAGFLKKQVSLKYILRQEPDYVKEMIDTKPLTFRGLMGGKFYWEGGGGRECIPHTLNLLLRFFQHVLFFPCAFVSQCSQKR